MNTCTPWCIRRRITYVLPYISNKLAETYLQYNGDIDDAESYPIRYEQIRK